MKNIFIGGVAKSGKSTVAGYIRNNNMEYNHIPVDYFASSFKHNFPECGITSNVVISKEVSDKISLFLSRVIHIIENGSELFLVDSAHVLPSSMASYIDENKWDVYFIGYPRISPEEKLKMVRKYEKENDWTFSRSDDDLLDVFTKLIDISKRIEEECNTYNFKFIDSSDDLFDFSKVIK